MSRATHLDIITSQLKNVQELKEQFEHLVDQATYIITKVQAWIDEKEVIGFGEINKFLTRETENCIEKCSSIVKQYNWQVYSNSDGSIPSPPSTLASAKSEDDFNAINMKLTKMEKLISKHCTQFRNLKQKLKSQGEEFEKISEKKYDEIQRELYAVNEFLESETEMLTCERREHEEKLNSVIQDLADQAEKINMLTTHQEANMFKSQSFNAEMEELIKNVTVNVQRLDNDVKTVKSDLVTFKTSSAESVADRMEKDKVLQNQVEIQMETISIELDEVKKKSHELMSSLISKDEILTSEKNKIERKFESLTRKLEDQEEKMTVLTGNQGSEKVKYFEIEKNIKSLHDSLQKQIQNQFSRVSDEVVEMRKDFGDFKSDVQRKDQAFSHHNGESLKDIQQKLADQEQNTNDLSIKHKNEVKKCQDIVEKLERSIDSLTVTVRPLKKDIETVSSEFSKLKTSNDGLLQDNVKNNEDFRKKVESKVVQVSSKVDEIFKDLTQLKNLSSIKISFCVGLAVKREVHTNSIVKYDTTFTNNGDCYNILTGIFTCPVDGIYVFQVGVLSERKKYIGLDLYQNNDYKMSVFAQDNNDYSSSGNSVILHLKQTDKVYLKAKDLSILYGKALDIINTFSGFLLAAG